MKIKNILSVLLITLCLSFNLIFVPVSAKNEEVRYYSDTSYFDSGTKFEIIEQEIEYDNYELYDTHLERLCPKYENYTQLNSCAPMAGTIVLGYFDYTCPELIPDFVAGIYYNGEFRYRPQSAIITTVKENLYTYMKTNTVAPGTSVAQFKTGLTNYVHDKGYNISYRYCGDTTNINTVIDCLNNQIPIAIFVNSYEYYPEVGLTHTEGRLSMIGKKSPNGHVVVALGYRQYKFYKNNALIRTENLLVVSFGDGTQGYLAINNINCIDEAYGININ